MTEAEVARRLQNTLPRLEVSRSRFLGAGDFTLAWIINDELVVRPRKRAKF